MAIIFQGGNRQAVDTIVVLVGRMPFDLHPNNFMLISQCEKFFPLILVFYWLFGGCAPAVTLPIFDPSLRERALKICAIGVKPDAARLLQSPKGLDGSLELHSVIRRLRGTACEYALMRSELKESRPAAGAGIAAACSVRVDRYFLHVRSGSAK